MERNLQGNWWTVGETYRSSQSSKTTTDNDWKCKLVFSVATKKILQKTPNDYTNDFWETCTFHQLPSSKIKKKKSLPQLPSHPAVQVVGRLIQQQNVAISHHCLGAPKWELETVLNVPFIEWWMPSSRSQQQFHAPTTAKFIHLPKMLMQRPQVPRNVVKESVRVGCFGCFALFESSECLTKPRQTIPTKWEEEKSSTKN